MDRRRFLVAGAAALAAAGLWTWMRRAGAPQSVYSDHYLDTLPLDGPIGFKLEAPPVYPVLASR